MAGEPNAPAETTTSLDALKVLNDVSAPGQVTGSLVNSTPIARLFLIGKSHRLLNMVPMQRVSLTQRSRASRVFPPRLVDLGCELDCRYSDGPSRSVFQSCHQYTLSHMSLEYHV